MLNAAEGPKIDSNKCNPHKAQDKAKNNLPGVEMKECS